MEFQNLLYAKLSGVVVAPTRRTSSLRQRENEEVQSDGKSAASVV
jgi:hypothetical protein